MMLKLTALDFNRLLTGPATFKASNGWLARFNSRHGIVNRKLARESADADLGSALEYATNTTETRQA